MYITRSPDANKTYGSSLLGISSLSIELILCAVLNLLTCLSIKNLMDWASVVLKELRESHIELVRKYMIHAKC